MHLKNLNKLSFCLVYGLMHTTSLHAADEQALRGRFCHLNCNRIFCRDLPFAWACRELCQPEAIQNCLKASGLPPKEKVVIQREEAPVAIVQEIVPKVVPKGGYRLPGMNLNPGETGYISLESVLPGQLRVDQSNIKKKAEEQLAFLGTEAGTKNFKLHKSALTEKQAVPVVKVREQGQIIYRVADSHHEVLAAIQHGSERIPVKVIADFTIRGDRPVKALEESGYVDLYDRNGKKHDQLDMDWSQLKDQQDDLRAYVTSHVKKIVWGSGEDKTPKVKEADAVIVKADKNPNIALPDSEVTLNTHLENRLSTALRDLEPSFSPQTSTTQEFKNILTKHLKQIQQRYPQFEKVRFVLDMDEEGIKKTLEKHLKDIESKGTAPQI